MSVIRKISFEITDNWSRGDFRNFIKVLLSDTDTYELFIISNDDTSANILRIGDSLGLDSDHVIVCNFTADKLEAIEDNDIDVHLDNLQSFTLLVEETTEACGVLVDGKWNAHYNDMQYVVEFYTSVQYKLDNSEDGS